MPPNDRKILVDVLRFRSGRQTPMAMTTNSQLGTRYAMIDPIIATGTFEAPGHFFEAEQRSSGSVRRFSRSLITNGSLVLGDVAVLLGGLAVGFFLSLALARPLFDARELFNFHSALAGCYVGMACLLGLHRATGMNPVLELRQQILSVTAAHGLVLVLSALFGSLAGFEFAAMAFSFVAACATLPIGRVFFRKFLARRSWWGESVVLVGTGEAWEAIRQFVENDPQRGLKIAGTIDLGNTKPLSEAEPREFSLLTKLLRTKTPAWVIIAAPELETSDVRSIVSRCLGVPNIVVLDRASAFPTLWTRSFDCAGRIGIHLQDGLLRQRMRILKRLMDLTGAALVGLVTLPLWVVAAVWIKIRSPGPVFYCQERIGRGGSTFRAVKFRTMSVDADRLLADQLAAHPELRAEWERDRKLRDDPRIIPGIGRFLRATSLDELPQLWNVLKGEMSLVGPRPIVADEISRYGSWYPLYLRVRPGLSGLWQVSGRNGTSYEDRVRLDAYYVMNWSPWLDAYILLRTPRAIVRREGAY